MSLAARFLLFLLGTCFLHIAVLAAPVADKKRSELQTLQEQIRNLQQDIAHGEESRGEVADQLADSERAISGSQRRLRDIARDKREAEADVQRLQAERERIEVQIAALRKQLGDTLYRVYVEGGEAGARRLFSGDDPNQLSRDAYYLEQIARQRAGAIDVARLALQDLQQVLAQAAQRRARLHELETDRIAEQSRLVDARQKQRAVLATVADKLRVQRREMAAMQRDQARLEKLLKGLEEIARKQEAIRKQEIARKQEAARRQSAIPRKSPPSTAVTKSGQPAGKSSSEVEPVVGRADAVVESGGSELAFAALKGRLHWPVKGELTGRFGAPRAEGGATWRGVFIRSAAGGDVRAVAGGTVAFADWLRGFGNLIIVDHGDGYMTIYGNNESLYKTPGQAVKTGEAIAAVGATGGVEESGLYFEIRHRGEPADPAKWVATQ